MFLIVSHAGFIVIEIFVYKKIPMVLFEILFGWQAYYCYMTMSSCAIYIYIVMLGLSVPLGILGIFTMMVNGLLSFIFYPCQLFLYALGAKYLYTKHKESQDGFEEWKRD